jgi:CheY-like chemotaxis protein
MAGNCAGKPQRNLASLRVLIVDDYQDGAETLCLLLSMLGHEARVSHCGASAPADYRVFRPDVVFLDLAMPGSDGFAVARQLRALQNTERLTIVALTGYADGTYRERAREHFDHYLVKPAEPEAVENILMEVAARNEAARCASSLAD